MAQSKMVALFAPRPGWVYKVWWLSEERFIQYWAHDDGWLTEEQARELWREKPKRRLENGVVLAGVGRWVRLNQFIGLEE